MSATYEIINIGTLPNDGSGDPLRVAFGKINNNFSTLFATTSVLSNAVTIGNSSGQVIFETPVTGFTQGIFQIRSSDSGTPDSQDIIISAQITNNLAGVKFTAYGTTFNGNALTSYSMDVTGSNVRIKADPIANTNIFHFISSQITYQGVAVDGIPIALDGYAANSIMSTENDDTLTTEQI